MTIILQNERCKCHKRVDYMFQCGHELVADKTIVISKYADRWLNTYYYCGTYPDNSPTNTSFYNQTIYDDIEIPPVVDNTLVNHYENDVECSQDITNVETENLRLGKDPRISYHDMV